MCILRPRVAGVKSQVVLEIEGRVLAVRFTPRNCVLHRPMWTFGRAPDCRVAGHPFATVNGWHAVLRSRPGGVNQTKSTASPLLGARPGATWRPDRAGLSHAGRS